MSDNHTTKLVRVEERLCQLSGVARARILPGTEGDEIHVMVVGQFTQDDMKRLKKDIETIYLLEVGERVDYRKISIAQVGEKPDDSLPVVRGRPALKEVAIEYGPRNSITARVTLDHTGESHSGTADGCSLDDCIEDVVRRATLQAIESLMGPKYRLQAQCDVNGERVVAEVTTVARDSGERRRFIGAAYKRDDLPTSIARSILHALNRQFERVLETE
ncbi:MAG: hypothetical protein NUW23_11410 [Firmicutes bacterium]|jgi:hypothetical protein|nr:hypothetical protein [Bacillota bacterium]